MPVIQVKDKQHTLQPGQTRIGAGPGVEVTVPGDAALGVQAVLDLGADNQVVIRRARDGAMVRVNGVVLGVEPTPLMHGDKVDVGGTEILFSEDKKVGATQFVSASDVASIAAKRSGPARATASTGGRLVSLVDGKEYQIPAAGVVFGREAGSDVVVAQPEVSRRHASIAPSDTGYVIQDLSTNGIWVNGNRVQGSQLLARADVVRVGTEEFRFYADVAPAKGAGTPASVPASSPHAQPTPVVATPVQAASTPSKAAPQAPPPAAASAPAAGHMEPPTVPAAVGQANRQEPSTAPSAVAAAPARPAPPPAAPAPAAPRPQPARPPKKEAATAPKQEKEGGVPSWVWLVIIIIVAVAAYFIGQRTSTG
ncbi:MAG: FHA domain-containing protein [Gemmatimonadaceae bacterium]